jgi:hypothetical protein
VVTTGFFLLESKYLYKRYLDDLHVWIIIEYDGQSILFPMPQSYISLAPKTTRTRRSSICDNLISLCKTPSPWICSKLCKTFVLTVCVIGDDPSLQLPSFQNAK